MANEHITQTGAYYDAHATRWEFLLRSYLGGDDYRNGKYLTKYKLESEQDYSERLAQTPLDNQCKNVVHIYSSFIWRDNPTREFGGIENDPALEPFLLDADHDGRSFNTIMREATVWSSVYGHCWLLLDKPSIEAATRAEELAADIRPYLTLITPENVFDWRYERMPSGAYRLIHFKVREMSDKRRFRIWTPESIELWEAESEKDPVLLERMDNPLGAIPAICVYAQRSSVRGVGVSDVADVADIQRAVYNELSEIEQLIRIANHPSLAKTDGTEASAGAGSVIQMPDDLDPGLKPFLLQPSSSNLDGIRASIEDKIKAVDRVTHLGAVRATEKQAKSGVALQTEFQMLNSKLSEKADLLELAEEQLWTLWCAWQGREWDGVIDYADSFDLRDYHADLEFLQMARASGLQSGTFLRAIDRQIAALVVDDDELPQAYDEIAQQRIIGQFATETEVA
tara:strand:- start:8462 stop:9826 length:1365 start_codon:yes stop_codon:yes gene_type:complete